MYEGYLCVSKTDMREKGINRLDFIIVSADAYVDHPSFAPALLGRWLTHLGFSAGVIAQPDWRNTADFEKLGEPGYAFLICPGNLDGMVNLYTVNKRIRSEDAYAPGGKAGLRPKRPCIAYTSRLKQAYPDTPVILGGIEASLRRFAHYDYWEDTVRRSILLDAKADLLVYGMGELPLKEIANAFAEGRQVPEMYGIPGICYVTDNIEYLKNTIELPSWEAVKEDKKEFARCFKTQYMEQDFRTGKALAQKHGDKYLVQNPPMRPMSTEELDSVYDLPFMREQHPMYKAHIPALDEVKFSLTVNRGCFGGCAFCSIHFHQGTNVQTRSKASVLQEAELLTKMADFKGYIHDVGGPTANFGSPPCAKYEKQGHCRGKSCFSPQKCPNLKANHTAYLDLLRSLRRLPGVKKVFIRSGIRFDYLLYDENEAFFNELVKYHVSGQLKVAPEHVSDTVLRTMRKPGFNVYREFIAKFKRLNDKNGLKQYVIPYFISSHPGCTLKNAIELAEYLRDSGFQPDQVQDFYPTPGTLSTCMYYTGVDPLTGKSVYVPRTEEEKGMQRALLQYRKPQNHALVKKALLKEGREDLIGFNAKALIAPRLIAAKKGVRSQNGKK